MGAGAVKLLKARLVRFNAAVLFRRILLSWMVAALIEYFILPLEERDISDFIGLSQMSFIRVVLLTALLTVALYLIPQRFHSPALERELTVIAFASLCITAYIATGAKDFMVLSAVMILVFVIYALWGWNGKQQEAVQPI